MLGTRLRAGWPASNLEPCILSRLGATQWASTAPGRPASGATGATRPPPPHPARVRLFHYLAPWKTWKRPVNMLSLYIISSPFLRMSALGFFFSTWCPLAFRTSVSDVHMSWPLGPFLVINLSSAIKVRKTTSVCPVLTSWAGRSKPHVTRDTNRHQWAGCLDRDLPAQDKKLKRVGRTQRSIKLKRCLFRLCHTRAHKLWVEVGLGTDNVLCCSWGRRLTQLFLGKRTRSCFTSLGKIEFGE